MRYAKQERKEMLKGEVVPLENIVAGTPIQVVGNLDLFENKPKLGVFNGISKHYKPNLAFVQLDVLNASKDFESRMVAVPKDSLMCKVLSGTTKDTINSRLKGWRKQNLASSLAVCGITITLGSDPEIFVVDGKGELLPAFDFLPSKAKKYNGLAFWDGFQAEFITAHSSCLAGHVDYIRNGLKAVLTAARLKDPKAKLSHQSVLEVPEKILMSCKPEHAALGCDPSKNIYGAAGLKVEDGRFLPLRFAGGHIHFGTGKAGQVPEVTERMIKACDAIAGVASVSLFAEFDSPLRRQYYGLAGEYRVPPHGVEWRTLSNAWLMHPAITHLVFDLARESARFGAARLIGLLEDCEQERVQDILNQGDAKAARKFLDKNRDVYVGLFKQIYSGRGQNAERGQSVGTMTEATKKLSIHHAFEVLMNGVESAVADPTDIAKNWFLDVDKAWKGHSEGDTAQWSKAVIDLHTGKKI